MMKARIPAAEDATPVPPARSRRRSLFWRYTRYLVVFALFAGGVWVPIIGYLKSVPPTYTSQASLILPGAGVSASVNLDSIGQASSYASSAFANNSVSPTETYKRLLSADRIRADAAERLGIPFPAFARPRVELVDQTGLINIEIKGASPEEARAQAEALLATFFAELDRLRSDDLEVREQSAVAAIEEYRSSVTATRESVTRLQGETGFLSDDQFAAQVVENDKRRAELAALQARLQDRTAYVAALEKALGMSAAQAARALDLAADEEYMALKKDASEKAALRAEAASTYGARHPKMIAATSTYEQAAEAALTKAVAITGLSPAQARRLNLSQEGDRTALMSDLLRGEAERAGLAAQYEVLAARYEAERIRLEKAAPAAARLKDTQRDFQVAEAVFASAIARAQSSKVDIFASYPLVQVLENPTLPEEPSSPRKKLAIAAGGAATTMILIALGLGWVRRGIIRWLTTPGNTAAVATPAEGASA
ncbi:hypothetical protein PSA7680_00794 [Pseudoruegeria aquimaris]|uniref:Chain length determinant protein n=1 Tax=Pseudoruegeria aquimaris TaxID=393663 RepID=A0A1Y5RPT2_9RHOB|nr:hypothetical protein [Pseudoruegeria aquimaris]SLN21514.1 hypothetical protein PSA7680_00794 [Pseudoruegeria aquimaris]